MYIHMIKQRKRALGKGFWGDKRIKEKQEERRRKILEASQKAK